MRKNGSLADMVIFRYLAKEIFVSLLALTSIILLIFLSNQFVQYLGRAASGNLPVAVVFKLMALEIPNLLGLLLPLGFYISALIGYGRLYAENEMMVLHACGYSQRHLMLHTLGFALGVAIVVALLVFNLNPIIATGRAELIRAQGVSTLIKTIMPERFREVSGGRRVFYVEELDGEHHRAKNIFLVDRGERKASDWKVLWAKQGQTKINGIDGGEILSLEHGRLYDGSPGEADFQVYQFERLETKLAKPEVDLLSDVRTLPTSKLWPYNNPDKIKASELHWRISVPVMVLVLAMLVIPLSQVNPRQGKFAKLIPAILIYTLYANMMFIGRDWLRKGVVPVWLGLWWLHGILLLLALGLIYYSKKRPS